jgi:lactoylglutathione lyase
MNSPTNQVQHIGISVVDLDRSVRWYTDFFGFTETKRFRKDDFEIEGAALQLGAMSLEILAPFHPEISAMPPASLVSHLRKVGTNHIAIGVSDISGCYERMSASGCSLMTGLIDGRFFFCADPDGTVLEVRKL